MRVYDPKKTWEDPWKPQEQAQPRWYKIVNILGYGLIFTGIMLLGFFANRFGGWLVAAGIVLLISLFLGTVSFTIGQVFFTWGQLRLLELMLIVAVLGNAVGLTLQLTRNLFGPHDVVGQPLLVAACVFVVIGSAAWSLWVIRCLALEATLTRLKVLAIGWLVLPAIYGVSAGWIHLLILNVQGTFAIAGKLAATLCIFSVGVYVLWQGTQLHKRARKAYWTLHSNNAPSETEDEEPPDAPPPSLPA